MWDQMKEHRANALLQYKVIRSSWQGGLKRRPPTWGDREASGRCDTGPGLLGREEEHCRQGRTVRVLELQKDRVSRNSVLFGHKGLCPLIHAHCEELGTRAWVLKSQPLFCRKVTD
jgi:hypothetical protein